MNGNNHRREALGTGFFATVYAEWDPLLGRSVAIKELLSNFARSKPFARAFLARAERLFDLDHDHVLAMYRVDLGRESPAIVRELAAATLEIQHGSGPMPGPEIEEILRHVLLGLKAMHERKLIHGAVKPQNIFRCKNGFKIGDFAVPDVTTATHFATDPALRYTAPELLRGEAASPASDLYALGLVAYELLLGQHRFDAIVKEPELPPLLDLLPAISPALSTTLQQMTKKAAKERTDDPSQALDSLGASSFTGEVSLTLPVLDTIALDNRLRPSKPKPVLDLRKLKRIATLTIAILLASSTILAVLFLQDQRPAERRALSSHIRRAAPPPAQIEIEPKQPSPQGPQSERPTAHAAASQSSPTAPDAAAETRSAFRSEPKPSLPVEPKNPPGSHPVSLPKRPPVMLPEAGPLRPPPVVPEEPKSSAEVSTASATTVESARPATGTGDSASALPSELESEILALEDLSKSTKEAYAEEERPNAELDNNLKGFATAAATLSKTFRKNRGRGLSAFKDKLLGRSPKQMNRQSLAVLVQDLVRRGSQIDGLRDRSPMGIAALGYWKEVRRCLKWLENSLL